MEENKEMFSSEEKMDELNQENAEEQPIAEGTAEEDAQKKQLEEALTQAADYKDRWMRSMAEFDNYRKRTTKEKEQSFDRGVRDVVEKLLPVLDNFERAEKALENVDDCAKIKESFDLVHKQVVDTLTKMGLEKIETEGKEFDPNFHEAVMQTPTSDHPEHTIINELQKGYKLGDKVLRASMVNVATGEE